MSSYRLPLLLAAVVMAVSSCVPTSKYQEAQQATLDNARKVEGLQVETDQLRGRIKQLESDLAGVDRAGEALAQDTALAGMRIRTLQNKLSTLENDLRALAARMGDVPEYRALMSHLGTMQDELVSASDKLQSRERDLADKSRELEAAGAALAESERELQRSAADLALTKRDMAAQAQQSAQELANRDNTISAQQASLDSARRDIERQAELLRSMEAQLRAKDDDMAALKTRIAQALAGFSPDELTVEHRDGKVYVLLEENLLFASGQWDVNDKGAGAIRQLAAVLRTLNDDVAIGVEGHTDNVPLHGQVIADNWDLSAKRATGVVRLLVAGGVPAKRLQAIGRGDSQPIATNDNPDGRRKNRRTEIVLTPNIAQILGQL